MKISAVTLAAVITAAATGTTAIPVDDPSNNHVVTSVSVPVINQNQEFNAMLRSS